MGYAVSSLETQATCCRILHVLPSSSFLEGRKPKAAWNPSLSLFSVCFEFDKVREQFGDRYRKKNKYDFTISLICDHRQMLEMLLVKSTERYSFRS